jgi:hypothetical protein
MTKKETEPSIGPKPAVFEAPPARSDPPPPPFRIKTIHVLSVLVVLLAMALPIYLAFTDESVKSAGATGFIGIFFGCLSVLLCLWRVALLRLRPQAQGIPALAAVVALLGLVTAVLGANAGYDDAAALLASDHALSLAERDAQFGALTVAARTTARLGFANLPGFAFAFLLLLLVIRKRREAAPMVPGAPGSIARPTLPVFVSLFGTSVAFFVTLVFAIRAAF